MTPTFTIDQFRAQYVRNAASLAKEVETARRVTNSGAGAEKGKRYRGWYFHQWVSRFVQCVMDTNATDEDMAPKAAMLARALGNG